MNYEERDTYGMYKMATNGDSSPDPSPGPGPELMGADTLSGNDVVAYSGGSITDVTRQSSGTKVIPDSSTADVRIIEGTGGSPTNITLAAATTTINSLMQSTSGGSTAATVTIGGSETLRVKSITAVPTATTTFALTLGAAVNTGTLMPATAGGNLLLVNSSTAANFVNANNNMTVNSVVADNTTASTVTKDGSGVLRLPANNTYSGGTVINAGTLAVKADANLGAAGAGITFNGPAALSVGNHPATTGATVDLGTRPITVNNGAVAGLYYNWANTTITISGAITGTGGIIWGRDPVLTFNGGSGGEYINLLSTNNTFTGPITIGVNNSENIGTGSDFVFNSLADSTNSMTFNFGNGPNFSYGTGGITNLSLASRPINLLNSTATFRNLNTTNTITYGTVSTSTAGGKSLNLSNGGAGGIIAGAITDGNGQIGVTKSSSGTWTFSGTNTYSGTTTLSNDGGQLTILGKPALSPYSTLVMRRSTTLSLRMDDAGTVNLGNLVQVGGQDTSAGVYTTITIDVRNNGGATTGSTLALGKLDFFGNPDNNASSRRIYTSGANGYRLQFGDVDLSYLIAGTATGGPQRLEPQSAPITITGIIRQVSGNTGASTVDNNLYLGGTNTANLISGSIRDAADYPANPNATPLNVYKGEAGEWTLSGTNTYSGTTIVSAGRLIIDGGSKSQCLPDDNRLTISGSGKVQLNAGVREMVGFLTLNAAPQDANPGKYGSSLSSATYTNDTYFAGTGVLYVGMPLPATGMLLIVR